MPAARAVSIALRTAHLTTFGRLLGGHAFGVEAGRLVPALLVRVPSAAGPLQGAWIGFVALAAAAAARALRARQAAPLFFGAFALTVLAGVLLGRLR